MNTRFAALLLVAFTAALTGCSNTKTIRVPVAPRVDLARYQTIGLVAFASNGNADAELERAATQQFLADIQEAQPGTRIVELGTESQLLSTVNRKFLDTTALKEISQQHGVDAILTGRLDVTKVKPQVSVSSVFKNLGVKADVDAALSARLIETATGATVWTDSAKMTQEVASASVGRTRRGKGVGHLGLSDKNAAFAGMIDPLAFEITDDFRTHYILKRVPKDYVETASVAE